MSTGDKLKEDGLQLFQEGAYAEAAEVFAKAKEAFEAEDNMPMVGEMLNNLGVINIKLDNQEDALETFNQACALFQDLGDREREMQVVGNLGDLYASLGDVEQATTHYRQAADAWQEMGDDDHYGRTLMALGEMQFNTGMRQEGLATYQVGLEHVADPTFRQRMILKLRELQARFMGG